MTWTKKEREDNKKAWEEYHKKREKRKETMKLIRFMRGDRKID